jgi:hypothetical protein
MADLASSALSIPDLVPTKTESADVLTVNNQPEGQPTLSVTACWVMARVRLIGIRISPTPAGVEFEPELTDAGLRQWIMAHPDAALAAQDSIESAVVATTHRASALCGAIHALNAGKDLQPEVKLSVQAEALKLADSIGWPFALALSAWGMAMPPMPTSGAPLRTGMYL